MKIEGRKFLALTIGAGLTVLALGCGRSDAPPVSSIPSNQISVLDHCTADGGSLVNANGVQLCRKTLNYSLPTYYPGFFPRLTPSDSNQAWSTGITVNPGDKLSFNNVGSWGDTKSNTQDILWIFHLTTWTTNCNQVSLLGVNSSDSKSVENENMPAGLLASDGSEVFLIGGMGTHVIKNTGTLKFGFNTPAGFGTCTTLTLLQPMTVTHCEDNSGKTYPCP